MQHNEEQFDDKLAHALHDYKKQYEQKGATQVTLKKFGGVAKGLRIASEFISAILLGICLGFGVDWLFGTTPWGLSGFLILGFVGGMYNIYKYATRDLATVDEG